MKDLGRIGEEISIKYLEKYDNLHLVNKNLHLKFTEIDLLYYDSQLRENVIVECKLRTKVTGFDIENFITRHKLNRLKGSLRYLELTKGIPARLDLVLICLNSKKIAKILYLKNFEA